MTLDPASPVWKRKPLTPLASQSFWLTLGPRPSLASWDSELRGEVVHRRVPFLTPSPVPWCDTLPLHPCRSHEAEQSSYERAIWGAFSLDRKAEGRTPFFWDPAQRSQRAPNGAESWKWKTEARSRKTKRENWKVIRGEQTVHICSAVLLDQTSRPKPFTVQARWVLCIILKEACLMRRLVTILRVMYNLWWRKEMGKALTILIIVKRVLWL